jgi:hypothetical protein
MPRQPLAIVGGVGIGPVMIGLPMAEVRGIRHLSSNINGGGIKEGYGPL